MSPAAQAARTAAEKSARSSGRSASFTQRERMVGITVEAPWPMRKNTVRAGGSSMALSSALAEAMVRSFAGSTIIARQPPGLVRLRKERKRRTSSTPIEAAAAAPGASPSTNREECAPAAICRTAGWLGGTSRVCGRRGAGGVAAQEKARRTIGEGCLADAALARHEPGVMQRARVERAQEGFLGRAMSAERFGEARMQRVAFRFALPGPGFRFLGCALCHPA